MVASSGGAFMAYILSVGGDAAYFLMKGRKREPRRTHVGPLPHHYTAYCPRGAPRMRSDQAGAVSPPRRYSLQHNPAYRRHERPSRLHECWPRTIADMLPAMLVTQTPGLPDRAVQEIHLGELLQHPALANLQPVDRDALHRAAEHLEKMAADGIALRLRIAHVGDVVPVGLLDGRAAAYCTTAPREVHVWINGDDVAGKSGMTAPVLLEVLAAAAGLAAPVEPWTKAALPGAHTLNTLQFPCEEAIHPWVLQCPAGEAINT